MATVSEGNVCLHEFDRAYLAQIFHPAARGLRAVENRLVEVLRPAADPRVRELVGFLLEAPGKRIRPALVLLSAGAVWAAEKGPSHGSKRTWIDMATAVELIHMASLIHDDLIDAAAVRHHRTSVNARWGSGVSVALGDYLCAKAFQLVVGCGNPRLFAVLGSGLEVVCEGELLQVLGRGSLGVSEEECLAVIEKKTAALFGACCGVGAVAAGAQPEVLRALQQSGVHTGIAFQVLDDCRDLLSEPERLGKEPAQDLLAGDVTLPVLCLLEYCRREGVAWTPPSGEALGEGELSYIRQLFRLSGGDTRIRQLVASQVGSAKRQLRGLADSDAAEALGRFADGMTACVSEILAR